MRNWFAIAMLVLGLAGCANEARQHELQAEVERLTQQIKQLEIEHPEVEELAQREQRLERALELHREQVSQQQETLARLEAADWSQAVELDFR
ncbi:MAG: hypothetical protein AB7S38_34150 [Vulcanimicrobiota bacterium]